MAPPEVAPAPITVWISSMKRIASSGCSSKLGDNRLQTLLEIATVTGTGEQCAPMSSE